MNSVIGEIEKLKTLLIRAEDLDRYLNLCGPNRT